MVYSDSHVHIANALTVKNILEKTQFFGKYKLYSCIDVKTISMQEQYIGTLKDFFAIPIIFKEINIEQENKYVLMYCNSHNKGIPVFLINDNKFFNDDIPYPIMKEHFLLHSANEYLYRSLYYEYLNNQNGFLILHCKDKIRSEYIKKLRKSFPKMNIIVAHLGRNVFENSQEIITFLGQFKYDENIYFDISTINDIDIIMLALSIIGNERILYGSDFPYEFQYQKEVERRMMLESKLYNNSYTLCGLIGGNFEKIKSRIYRK